MQARCYCQLKVLKFVGLKNLSDKLKSAVVHGNSKLFFWVFRKVPFKIVLYVEEMVELKLRFRLCV